MQGFKFYWRLAVKNIKSYKRLYRPLILASAFLFSLVIMIISIKDIFILDGETINTFVTLGIIVIGIFSLLFYYFGRRFLFRTRGKEFGLLTTLGLGKPQLIAILFIELTLSFVLTSALALVLAFIFGPLITLIFQKLLELPLEISWRLSPASIGVALLIFAVIHLISFIPEIRNIAVKNPKEFFTEGKKHFGDAKTSWLLALVAAVFLGLAYYFALTIEDPLKSAMTFFAAIILVILGTYAFFHALLVVVLKALRNTKKIYHKPQNFVNLSGMLYRIKEHATGMANITILACMIIVTLTMTITFFRAVPEAAQNGDLLRDTRFDIRVQGVAHNVDETLRDDGQVDLNNINLTIQEAPEQLTRRVAAAENILDLQVEPAEDYIAAYLMSHEIDNRAFHKMRYYTLWYNADLTFWVLNRADADAMFLLDLPDIGVGEAVLYYANYEIPEGAMVAYIEQAVPDLTVTVAPEKDLMTNSRDASRVIFLVLPDVASQREAVMYLAGAAGETFSVADGYFLEAELSTKESFQLYNDEFGSHVRFEPNFSADDDPNTDAMFYGFNWASQALERAEFLSTFGMLLFIGVFCGMTFLIGMTVITWFRQISEAESERRRVRIMQEIGLEEKVIRKASRSQIFWILILPLLVALIHCSFALPYMHNLLSVFSVRDMLAFQENLLTSWSFAVLFLVLFYVLVYHLSAGSYWRALEVGSRHDTRR